MLKSWKKLFKPGSRQTRRAERVPLEMPLSFRHPDQTEWNEGIATNILADRLRKLEAAGMIGAEAEEADRRRVSYRLTEKGIDLAPVLLELLIWGARHDETAAPCALIGKTERNREDVLAEVRRRWQERNSTPLIPRFSHGDADRHSGRRKK